MKLLVGLGNPGEKYDKTRHNLGFMVVEKFLRDFEPLEKTTWSKSVKLKSEIVVFDWQPKAGKAIKVVLAKPQTFMNNSGMAVKLIADFYKIAPDDIWVAYDELDLPVGSMKIRFGGAAAGHRGVESIMETLGTDKFWRFRFGIGLPRSHRPDPNPDGDGNEHPQSRGVVGNVEEYVLTRFGSKDSNKIREMIKAGSKAFQTALEKDMKTAQNRFNTK